MITMDTCHAVHPVYGTLECPAERGQPQFLKRFPRRNAPPTSCDGAFRPTSWQALLCDWADGVCFLKLDGSIWAVTVLDEQGVPL